MVHPYICLQISPRRASSTDVNGEAEQPDDTAEGEGEGEGVCLSFNQVCSL